VTDDENAILEVWKVTIDVQKHFNDLSMRVRNFAITVLGAFLAAAGYALKDGATVTFLDETFSLTAWILLAAFLCWFAFYLMDLHWYHRLLRGAVKHGKAVERVLESRIPAIGLTHSIDRASPIYGLRASQRLTLFYGLIGSLLLTGALAAFRVSSLYLAAPAAAFAIGVVAIFLTRPDRAVSKNTTETTPAA